MIELGVFLANKFTKPFFIRVLNISVRAITLISRFFLLFLIAKYLSPSEVAVYGTLTASISYLALGMGLDFYTYSNRNLILANKDDHSNLIYNQFTFYLFLYLIICPFLYFLFRFLDISPNLFYLLIPIIFIEHLIQEVERVLGALSKQFLSSVVFYLRSGNWAIFLSLFLYAWPKTRNLDFILGCWLFGLVFCLVISILIMKFFLHFSLKDKGEIKLKWIWTGIIVSLPFLLSTLSLRGLSTFDRWSLDVLGGKDVLAAYVFFGAFASMIMNVLDAGVISFNYPLLVKVANNGIDQVFFKRIKFFFQQVFFLSGTLIIFVLISIKVVLHYLDNYHYSSQIYLLYWSLAAVFFSCISSVPHYALYALRKDKYIFFSHFFALVFFFFCVYFLKQWDQIQAVPISVFLSFVFIFLYKMISYKLAIS